MKRFIFFSLWIFFIISCEPESSSSIFGEVEGYVYFENEYNPAQGLQVVMAGYGMRILGAEGHFKIPEVVAGEYNIDIFNLADLLYSEKIEVKPHKTTYLKIILPPLKRSLPDFSVVDVSEDCKWDYWVVGKEEYFYIDEENSKPKSVFYHSFKKGKDYGITFDSNGLPSKVLTDNFIFLFDNFNGNKVDLGIISPSGEIQVVREIKTDFVWPTPLKSSQSKADIIRWTGRILGAIPCVTSGAAALVSGGAAIPLALWTCGNYFLSMANNFFDDAGVENGFTRFIRDYKLGTTVYNCTANPDFSACLISLANKGLSSYADYIEEMEKKEDEVRVAEASLYAGYGDIQITLTWNNTSDLDLHVIDPFNEEIYFNHNSSVSGGILDYDDTNGYGPENVYWPKLKAPKGTYQVFVHDYFWVGKPSSANYTILITAFDRTKKFTGVVNLDKTVHIVDFNENALKSAEDYLEVPKITIDLKK